MNRCVGLKKGQFEALVKIVGVVPFFNNNVMNISAIRKR